MWPGMRPATGWMAYFTSTPCGLQLVAHLAERVLGLGHRHAVARHDDHLGRVLQDEGGVLGRAVLDRLLLGRRRRGGGLAAEAAEDDRDEERFIPLHMM